MKQISVSITPKNTRRYPLHRHSHWEIMCYLEGDGYLATEDENIPFRRGSIIIVPPNHSHGSVSEAGFVNISVGGDFRHLFLFDKPQCLQDENGEGRQLAELIYRNRYGDADYLRALCDAYGQFLLRHTAYEDRLHRTVSDIVRAITDRFADPDLSPALLLADSGYAEDYIRAQFRAVTGHTPTQLLTTVRLSHAEKLLDIYGDSLSVAEIAAACGFEDAVYFSKRFKQYSGLSPAAYKKSK